MVTSFLHNDEKIKDVFLNGKKAVTIIIVYEESLGKTSFYKYRLKPTKNSSSNLYKDIRDQLELENKILSPDSE